MRRTTLTSKIIFTGHNSKTVATGLKPFTVCDSSAFLSNVEVRSFYLNLNLLHLQELTDINNVLKGVFLIFPNYCLGRGLIDLAKNQFMDMFSRFGGRRSKGFTAETLVKTQNFYKLIVTGIVYIMSVKNSYSIRIFISRLFI